MIVRFFGMFFVFAVTAFAVFAQSDAPIAEKERLSRSLSFSISGSNGYLGVQTGEVSKENFSKFGLSAVRGVVVESVTKDSPAERAGIQANDVIVTVNGEEIASTRKLSRVMSEIAPDHQARLTILRNGAEQQIDVTVGKRPGIGSLAFGPSVIRGVDVPSFSAMPGLPNIPEAFANRFPQNGTGTAIMSLAMHRRIGTSVMSLTKQLADHFGVDGGLLVTSVVKDSAAEKAGIKAGDILYEADGKVLNKYTDLSGIMTSKKNEGPSLTIVRNKQKLTVQVDTSVDTPDRNFIFPARAIGRPITIH